MDRWWLTLLVHVMSGSDLYAELLKTEIDGGIDRRLLITPLH